MSGNDELNRLGSAAAISVVLELATIDEEKASQRFSSHAVGFGVTSALFIGTAALAIASAFGGVELGPQTELIRNTTVLGSLAIHVANGIPMLRHMNERDNAREIRRSLQENLTRSLCNG